MTASRDRDRLLDELLRGLVPAEGSPSVDVDLELLVSVVEGRASEAERGAVLRQLEGSEEGRRLAAALVDLGDEGMLEPIEAPAASAASAPRRPHLRLLALAALVVITFGAALWAGGVFEVSLDPEARLVAAARRLADTAPDVFEGFLPLDAEERAAPGPAALRGGIRVLRPAGLTLDVRPRFAWAPVPGVSAYDVRVVDEEGSEVFSASTRETSSIWTGPEDTAESARRGRTYVGVVAADGPLGRVTGERTFTVASAAQVQRFESARRLIGETQPEELRSVLLANFAIREGLLEEAERLLGAHVAAYESDALARETLRYVLRHLGEPAVR